MLRWLAPLALVVLVGAAYAPTLDAEFVVWDDDDHIYENPHVIGSLGYGHAWKDWRNPLFYPLSYTAFWVDWRLSGGEPWLFHLNNVLLHAADVVLLGLVGRALGLAAPVAWAAAGLWGLNPLQVQTVAWATERKNVLYVFFYLAALLAYARSLDDREREHARFWLLALLLGLLSVLSKPAGVTFPAALVLLHFARARPFDHRAVGRLAAGFLVAAPVLVMHLAREQLAPGAPLSTRLLIAARAVWWYVGAFLWPVGLVPTYPRWPVEEEPLPSVAGLVALAAVAGVAVWQRRRLPRSVLFAAGFYAINVAPVVGIIWFPYLWYSLTADHLAYLPSAGLAWLVAIGAAALAARLHVPRALGAAAVVVLGLVLAGATHRQTALWHDTESLWRGTLAVNPESAVAHKNLGFALLGEGRLDEASEHFRATLELRPADTEALLNLGLIAAERGDLDGAVALYLRVLGQSPENAQAWTNLGIAVARKGDLAGAIAAYERAIAIDPEDPIPRTDLGAARVESGDVARGIEDHRAALRLNPRFFHARYNLGMALLASGRFADAARELDEASRLEPRDADAPYHAGLALGRLGRHREAAERYRAALARAPDHAAATNNLAASLLVLGEDGRAIALFERALQLAPDDPDSHRILASVLERTGRIDAAVRVLERALARFSPAPPSLARQLAWIRATSAQPDQRDGEDAVALAEAAVAAAEPPDPRSLDTLAAAYAAVGRFDDAVRTARRALDLGGAASAEAAERQRRLALYEAGEPFRAPAPSPAAAAP